MSFVASCGTSQAPGRRRVIAFITDAEVVTAILAPITAPDVITRILAHLGLPSAVPAIAPARAPPTDHGLDPQLAFTDL